MKYLIEMDGRQFIVNARHPSTAVRVVKEYLTAGITVRKASLEDVERHLQMGGGIMDSDGYVPSTEGKCQIAPSPRLVSALRSLLSMG